MATGHFDYTTGTLEKEKLRNRDRFFPEDLQKMRIVTKWVVADDF